MVQPVPFYIDVTDRHKPALFVDGEDWTERYRIKRVGFEISAGSDPARLFIELLPGAGVIEGEAVVHQIGDLDQREAVLAFLGNLSPQALETAALSRGGLLEGSGDETMGESFLAALKEMIGGD